MSDTPIGEGWWLASDGKYYPPNMTPASLPPDPPTPPAPGPTLTAAEPGSKPPWWKRRWVIITASVFVVLLIIGALAGDDEEDGEEDVATEEPTADADEALGDDEAEAEDPEPIPEEPTATPEPEPTATPAPTATPEPTATPTPEPLSPEEEIEIAQVAFGIVFEDTRTALIEVLADDINVQSVDRYEWDAELGAVVVDITSGWASPDNQVDGAWELTRAFAQLWAPADGAWHQDVWTPDFRLTNSGTVYACPAEFMVALGDVRASRADWQSTC